jgi:hypothetical protein
MRNRFHPLLAPRPLCGLLMLAPLAGCGGTAPVLTVTEAYVAERSESGTVVHFVVKAQNVTLDPLPMRAIGYTPSAQGAPVGKVDRWAQATAPPGGTVIFEIPVAVPSPAPGSSTVSVAGKVAYVPGGHFRELLGEIDLPLPTTDFAGTLPIDWTAAPRPAPTFRAASVRTGVITDRGPIKAADTLPPLKNPQ